LVEQEEGRGAVAADRCAAVRVSEDTADERKLCVRRREKEGHGRVDTVGRLDGIPSGNEDIVITEDCLVQVVVDHEHVVLGRERAADAVHLAREGRVCNGEGRLPNLVMHMREFRHSGVYEVRTIWNSGMRYGTAPLSAPESMKTTTRFPESIIDPSVGHSLCLTGVPGVGGTKANWSTPEFSNAGAQTVFISSPSGFVKIKVRTSFGFASRKVLTVFR
jgi:hypothetical protein